MLDMAKGGGPESQDWRTDEGIGDDLDAEDICQTRAAVVAKGAKDEVLALLVEDEYARDHVWLVPFPCTSNKQMGAGTSLDPVNPNMPCPFDVGEYGERACVHGCGVWGDGRVVGVCICLP